jgi:hypothetical protein
MEWLLRSFFELQCARVARFPSFRSVSVRARRADTSIYECNVEPFVRGAPEDVHGVNVESRVLVLTSGGTHEFDAIANDGSIVASLKSLSAKTRAGNNPDTRHKSCLADPIFSRSSKRRDDACPHNAAVARHVHSICPGAFCTWNGIDLIKLLPEMQAIVDKIRDIASNEVSPT